MRVCQRLSVAEPLVVRDCKCYFSESNRDAGWQSTYSPLPTLRCPPQANKRAKVLTSNFLTIAPKSSNSVGGVTMPKDSAAVVATHAVPHVRVTTGSDAYHSPGVAICRTQRAPGDMGCRARLEGLPSVREPGVSRVPGRLRVHPVPAEAHTCPPRAPSGAETSWACLLPLRSLSRCGAPVRGARGSVEWRVVPIASPRGAAPSVPPRAPRPPRELGNSRASRHAAPASRAAAPPPPRPCVARKRSGGAARSETPRAALWKNDGERGGRAPKRTGRHRSRSADHPEQQCGPRGHRTNAPRSARARRPHDRCPRSPPRRHAPGRRAHSAPRAGQCHTPHAHMPPTAAPKRRKACAPPRPPRRRRWRRDCRCCCRSRGSSSLSLTDPIPPAAAEHAATARMRTRTA